MVEVTVSRTMDVPPDRVAAIMFDPGRDPEWIGGAKRVEELTSFPYGLGSKVRREGGFLGRRFSWTTEVIEYAPGKRVGMRYVAGPFTGGVDYAIAPHGSGTTVTIRNHGSAKFQLPFMAQLMRMSVAADLRRLEALVHAGS